MVDGNAAIEIDDGHLVQEEMQLMRNSKPRETRVEGVALGLRDGNAVPLGE